MSVRAGFLAAFMAATLVLLATGCGGGEGNGPGWAPRIDPLRKSSGTIQHPDVQPPRGLELLRADLAAGRVSLADSYRYRLSQYFGLGNAVPTQYRAVPGQQDTDLILEELAADLDRLDASGRAELEPWTLPWLDARHPFGARLRSRAAAVPRAASPGGSMRALPAAFHPGTRWGAPAPSGAAAMAGLEPELCPHDTVIAEFFDQLEDVFCWVKPSDHAVVYWVRDDDNAQHLLDIASTVISETASVLEHHLDVFSASPAELIYRSGEESILIGLWSESQLGIQIENDYLGVHHWNEAEHRSYVEVVVDDTPGADFNLWHQATLAHELFHAMQWQFLDEPGGGCYGKWESPCQWIIEGMASWAEKHYLGNRAADIPALIDGLYHPRMRHFIEADDSVQNGAESVSYPGHLLWHELVATRGLGALKGTVLLYETDGRNDTALGTLDLETSWHELGKYFYNQEPWKRMHDAPKDFPDDMQLGIGVLFLAGSATFDVEELTLPRVSVLRATISFGGGNPPPFVQVRLDPADRGTPLQGVRISAALPDPKQELQLEVGETGTICFSGSDPQCQGKTIYSPSRRVELVVSNARYDVPSQQVRLAVATLPIEFRATSIRVGDTDSNITGDLTMARTTDDTIEFDAESMWFDFDDEVYERLIPDQTDPGKVDISPAVIRGYVKAHAQFRGFMELEYEFDEDKEPTREDGRWWVELKTRRGHQGNFFATPHRFFIGYDPAWFQALGGGTGVMGPGGIVYQRMIDRLNRTRFPKGSFADTLQGWFTRAMTLGTGKEGTGTPRYSVDSSTGEVLFRAGNTTLTLRPR